MAAQTGPWMVGTHLTDVTLKTASVNASTGEWTLSSAIALTDVAVRVNRNLVIQTRNIKPVNSGKTNMVPVETGNFAELAVLRKSSAASLLTTAAGTSTRHYLSTTEAVDLTVGYYQLTGLRDGIDDEGQAIVIASYEPVDMGATAQVTRSVAP